MTFNGPVPDGMLGQPVRPDMSVPQEVIDYILVINRPGDPVRLQLLGTEVKDDRYYSDHFPVVGKIRILHQ